MERCGGCGFTYDLSTAESTGIAIVEGATAIGRLVADRGFDVTLRPQAATWSPLEFACHVRDVLLVQRERVLLARRRETPALEPMGRDERVDHDGYAHQEPDDVARQLTDAAELFANVLSRLGARDWERTVVYNYPAPAERSLRWLAVHTLHEVLHHTADIERQLRPGQPEGP
jgi:hypothetical protein